MLPQEADASWTTTQTILLNSKVIFPKFSSWTLIQDKTGALDVTVMLSLTLKK